MNYTVGVSVPGAISMFDGKFCFFLFFPQPMILYFRYYPITTDHDNILMEETD